MSRHKNPFSSGGRGAGGRPGKDPQIVWQQAAAASQAGNHAQAEKLLRQFLKATGPRPETLRALAGAQSQLGKHLEARKTIERALELAPDNPQLLLTQGSVLLLGGRPTEARVVYQRLLKLRSEPAATDWFNLALAQRQERDVLAARASFEKALELDPRLVPARHEYASTLAELGDLEAAAREAARCTELDPKLLAGWLTLGSIERRRSNHAAAIACYDAAIKVEPRLPACHSNKGQVLREYGRTDEAIACFEAALALQPDDPTTRVMLAHTRRYPERNAEVAWMEKAARGKAPPLPPGSHPIALHDAQFAYAKMLADMGEDVAGFAWLHKANAAKRKTLDYDFEADLAHLDRIRETFDAATLARAAEAGGCADPTPIFVVGMPRSGTTLVESLLNAHPEIAGAGELPFLQAVCGADPQLRGDREPLGVATASAEALRRGGEEYVRRLRARLDGGPRFVVDKLPPNALRVGAIRLLLPAAKIVCMRRDARDTCLSNYKVNFESEQEFSYDLRELGRYHRAYDAMLDHWAACLADDVFLEVDYQRLVENPEREAQRICAFLGIAWDERMLRFHEVARGVLTASVDQVRNPIHRSSVGAWERHAAELQPLLEALAPTDR